MALDILISDFHDNPEKLIRLGMGVYDLIKERLENVDGFELTKKVLSDYYGENEIYLNERDNFKAEVLALQELFHSSSHQALKDFIIDLLSLIDDAIARRRTIKFIGD